MNIFAEVANYYDYSDTYLGSVKSLAATEINNARELKKYKFLSRQFEEGCDKKQLQGVVISSLLWNLIENKFLFK